MKVRWNNVVAFALLILATVLLARNHGEISRLFSDMSTGRGHAPEQQGIVTFAVFGVILVAIVAIVKILVHKNQDK